MLSYALPYFEVFMLHLTELGEQQHVLKPWTDVAKACATKYYIRMDDTDAYVVTLCTFYIYIIPVCR